MDIVVALLKGYFVFFRDINVAIHHHLLEIPLQVLRCGEMVHPHRAQAVLLGAQPRRYIVKRHKQTLHDFVSVLRHVEFCSFKSPGLK